MIFTIGFTFILVVPPLLFVGYALLNLSCTATIIFTGICSVVVGIIMTKLVYDWQRKPRL
jgi:hypothetical protein